MASTIIADVNWDDVSRYQLESKSPLLPPKLKALSTKLEGQSIEKLPESKIGTKQEFIRKHMKIVIAIPFLSLVASLQPIIRTSGPEIAKNKELNGMKMNNASNKA